MSSDEPDFGGEPSSSFETLPAQKVRRAPGDEIERAYLGAVLGDPDGALFRQASNLPSAAFNDSSLRKIWDALRSGIKVDDVPEIMRVSGVQFAEIAELCQLDRLGTMAGIHLGELWRRWRKREIQRLASDISNAEDASPEEWKKRIDALGEGLETTVQAKPFSAFEIPADGDKTILLGNRFLNRGDGGVLVSTSGVGKSSLSLQAAVLFALGHDLFGIKPNGSLKSLVIQAEDSDGDMGEIWYSIRYKLGLSKPEMEQVGRNVVVVTDRTHRGPNFIASLRALIRQHKPDLIWINPLQAFIDGDVTDSQDLGAFLREGLNSLNEPPTFGFILVHHTTKPPTDKNSGEVKWHEQMYQMAGGAEIINWARFIMSLRATDDEGKFNLVLAKRGRRAGVTKQVEQGAGFRDEIVTSIPIQHSTEHLAIPARKEKLSVIFWEASDHDPKAKKAPVLKNPYGPTLEEILPALRVPKEKALNGASVRRAVSAIRLGITPSTIATLLAEGVATGKILKTGEDREPKYYAA